MSKTHYLVAKLEGSDRYIVLCDYRGDNICTHAFQNISWTHEEAYEIANKLNDVLALGTRQKAEEIRRALGGEP